MPVITINNPKSEAHNRSAFWFDQGKPRKASISAKKEALRRLNEFRLAANDHRLRKSDVDSVHHLNQDRSNGDPENLFVCTSADQHNKIELQATELFTTLFDMGKIGFDYASKKYFVACDYLDKEIKSWLKSGRQINWKILDQPRTGRIGQRRIKFG